jgi:hypothetical protein
VTARRCLASFKFRQAHPLDYGGVAWLVPMGSSPVPAPAFDRLAASPGLMSAASRASFSPCRTTMMGNHPNHLQTSTVPNKK